LKQLVNHFNGMTCGTIVNMYRDKVRLIIANEIVQTGSMQKCKVLHQLT